MPKDLRTFLDTVMPLGSDYYVEVRQPITPDMELAALQYKLAGEGRSPIIFCPNVAGSKLPAITNVLGTYERVGLALDIPAARLRPGSREAIVREYGERLKSFREPVEVPVDGAPVRDQALTGDRADLSLLPVMQHAPLNSGKYITAAMTILRDPDSGVLNVGVYRHELKGRRRLAMAPVPGQHGNSIVQRYAALKRPMQVVTVIGHHPACLMAASMVRPDKRNENEFKFMGALLGEPLEVTEALTVDLPVPARAEIAIEGMVDPLKMEAEGPFSEDPGFYGEGRACWVIDVTAMTMRRDAIYEDLHPTQAEHLFPFLLQREHNVLTAVRTVVPGVRSVHIGLEDSCAKSLLYLSIKKESDDDVLRAGMTALKNDWSRVVIVVDDDIDVCDESAVLWATATTLNRVAFVDAATGKLASIENPVNLRSPSNAKVVRPNTKVVLDATRAADGPVLTRADLPSGLLDRITLGDYIPRR